MSEILKDPMFFYAIAFVIFAGLAWKFGHKPALQMLDDQIIKIRDELQQARELRICWPLVTHGNPPWQSRDASCSCDLS